jgi:hypothetical protein
MATAVMAVAIPLWGMIGIWTDKLGCATHLLTSGPRRDMTYVFHPKIS